MNNVQLSKSLNIETKRQMLYEAEAAYADYQNGSGPVKVNQKKFESVRYDDDDYLVKVVSNDSLEACHFIDVKGHLVDWRVKLEGEYFQFIGDRTLEADAIMKLMEKIVIG